MPKIQAALAALLLFFCGGAQAAIILKADLTHSQETVQGIFQTSAGDPRPQSFGNAVFIINDAQTSMSFTATIFNIDLTGTQTADSFDNLVAAHIHAAAPPGANGPVRWGFFGAPDNDNAPDDLVVTPFVDAVGGIISSKWDLTEGNGGTTLTDQLPNIFQGLSYINFHTVQFGGGEIRGQILLAVPEPATLTLLLCAGLGLAVLKRASVLGYYASAQPTRK